MSSNTGGRQKLPARQRAKVRPTRFSDDDWTAVKKAAKAAGLKPLTYVRVATVAAAARAVKKLG